MAIPWWCRPLSAQNERYSKFCTWSGHRLSGHHHNQVYPNGLWFFLLTTPTMGLDTTKWLNARRCQKLAGFSMRIANPGSPFYWPTDRFVRSRKRGMWWKCTPPWGVGRWMHVSSGHLLSTPHVNLTLLCHHDRVGKLNLCVILRNNRSAAALLFVTPSFIVP